MHRPGLHRGADAGPGAAAWRAGPRGPTRLVLRARRPCDQPEGAAPLEQVDNLGLPGQVLGRGHRDHGEGLQGSHKRTRRDQDVGKARAYYQRLLDFFMVNFAIAVPAYFSV